MNNVILHLIQHMKHRQMSVIHLYYNPIRKILIINRYLHHRMLNVIGNRMFNNNINNHLLHDHHVQQRVIQGQ